MYEGKTGYRLAFAEFKMLSRSFPDFLFGMYKHRLLFGVVRDIHHKRYAEKERLQGIAPMPAQALAQRQFQRDQQYVGAGFQCRGQVLK
jgi:hypothetical protein